MCVILSTDNIHSAPRKKTGTHLSSSGYAAVTEGLQ